MLFYFKYSELSSIRRIKKQTKLIFTEFHYFTVVKVFTKICFTAYAYYNICITPK